MFVFLFAGHPDPKASWLHDGKPVKLSSDIKESYIGARTAKLTFTEVYPEDKGVYECVATNLMGEAKTSCTVTVKGLFCLI